MKREWLIVLAALLVLAGLVLWLTPTDEPLHKGKPISYWVDQACRVHPNEAYVQEIANIGPPAVSHLVARLGTRQTWLRTAWAGVWVKLPQWPRDVLPAPANAHLGWVTSSQCFDHLGSQGESAVPGLTKLLRRPGIDSVQCYYIASALEHIGPKAKAALPALRGQLSHRPLVEQVNLATVMWNTGEDAGFICGVYSNALTQNLDDGAAMNAAAGALSMGVKARPLAPVLAQAATNAAFSPGTQGNALGAIGQLRLTNEMVIRTLLAGAQHPDIHVRARSGADLWRIDPQYAGLAVPALVSFIVDKQSTLPAEYRQGLLDSCLRKLDVTMALPALAAISTNDTPESQQVAAKALRELEARAAREAAKP
jgi:hypothetical protein